MILRPCRGLAHAVVLLAFTATAHAQTVPSPYRFIDETQAIGVFGGYAIADPGALDLGPRSAPAFGARYSLRINGPFVFEGEAAFVPTTREVVDTSRTAEGFRRMGRADLSLLLLQGSLRFNITGPRTFYNLTPYLVVGGGGALEVAGDDALDQELGPDVAFDFGTTFAANIGAGAEWFATRRITLRADVRDVFWALETPEPFLEQDTDGVSRVPDSEWVQNFFLLLGVSYRF